MRIQDRILSLFGRVESVQADMQASVHESFIPGATTEFVPPPPPPEPPAKDHVSVVAHHVNVLLVNAMSQECQLNQIIADAHLARAEVRTTIEAFQLAAARLVQPLEVELAKAIAEQQSEPEPIPAGVAVYAGDFYEYRDSLTNGGRPALLGVEFSDRWESRFGEFPDLHDVYPTDRLPELASALDIPLTRPYPVVATAFEGGSGGSEKAAEEGISSQRRGSHGRKPNPDRPAET